MRVFLSSTKTDLEEERQAVHDAVAEAGHEVVWMEDFGSRDEAALEACLSEIGNCDTAVVIVGHRYGSIVPRSGLSYTEAEYERAREDKVRVHAYVKDGFDQALDSADHPLRLLDFRDALEDAHTVHHPYFHSAAVLAHRAVEDLRRVGEEPSRRRPRFGRHRRAVRDPSQYAYGDLRHIRLVMYPFRIGLVDLAVIDQPVYDEVGSRRLRNKVLEVRDQMDDRGANVFIFNEIPVQGAQANVISARLLELKAQTEAIVCFVRGRADAEALPQLADVAPKVSVWYPQRIEEIEMPQVQHAWQYTDSDLSDCSLARRVVDYLDEEVSKHLVESLRNG
jgi:hypothetical protein